MLAAGCSKYRRHKNVGQIDAKSQERDRKAEVREAQKSYAAECVRASVCQSVCAERHQIKSEKPTGNSPLSKAVGEQAVFKIPVRDEEVCGSKGNKSNITRMCLQG